mgnify:FL=1
MKNKPFKIKYNMGGKHSMLQKYNDGALVADETYANMNADQFRQVLIEREIEMATFDATSDEEVSKGAAKATETVNRMSDEAVESALVQEQQAEMDANMDIGNQNYETNRNMGFADGGMLKYNEGSMLVPPEMEMGNEMPVDTYDNIPEDEKEAAEASQLPDDEMEEDYTSYVLEESLDMEEQEYLMGVLESDERLSGIFDKVMDIAGEFSGEGEVEGLGTGVSDSIPARLSDGEFVFTKKATDQMGADQLQTMMDEAEKAYDGGLMKKAFGGMVDDIPTDERKEDEEINSMMIASNQMPSVRPR